MDHLKLQEGDEINNYSIISLKMHEFAQRYPRSYEVDKAHDDVWLVTFTGGISWSEWGDWGYGDPVRTLRYVHIVIALEAETGEHITTLGQH